MRTTSRLLRPLLPLSAMLLCALPTRAQAGITPALDLGLAFADGSTTSDQALRVGYTLPLPLLHVTPELGLRIVGLETEASMMAPIVGARVGFGSVIVPSLYLHGGNAKDVGLILDGGLAIDFTLLPLVHGGVHAQVTDLDGGSAQFVTTGLHVGANF